MKVSVLNRLVRMVLCLLAVIAVTGTVLVASDLLYGPIRSPQKSDGQIPSLPDELRALTVRTQDNADFPSQPNLPAKLLQQELDDLISFAQTYHYNALFFEVVGQADAFYSSQLLPTSAALTGEQGEDTFFDPLAYLVEQGNAAGLQIYAVIDPYDVSATPAEGSPAAQHPEWVMENQMLNPSIPEVQNLLGRVAGELSQYDIAGVVLSGVDSAAFDEVANYGDCLADTAQAMRAVLRTDNGQRLGMVVSGGAISQDGSPVCQSALEAGALDFLVGTASGAQGEELVKELSAWQALCGEVAYYPLHAISDETAFTHAVDNALYYERQMGVPGIVISNYGSLHTDRRTAAYQVAAAFQQDTSPLPIDLSYPQTFSVTRPTSGITLTYDWTNYFITGTSDPEKPLTIDGQEIPRYTETGLWGYLVDLAYGTNTFTISQGSSSETVTIQRLQPSGTSTIDNLVKSSLYPSNSEAVLEGDALKLSCTAPAGGSVSASVGGLTVQLEPVDSAQEGVPLTYQATLDLSALTTPGEVTNLGVVTYRLTYNGLVSTQQSAGEVYAAGAGAIPVAKMKTYVVPSNANPADDGEYRSVLKRDCVDYITENTGSYYKLSYGGYVLKSTVDILEGDGDAENQVTQMTLRQEDKGEKLLLTGTVRPAFVTQLEEDTLRVTLYHTGGFENLNPAALQSELCQSITAEEQEDGSVELAFHLQEGVTLLGWDVQFEENTTIIYLKKAPLFQRETAQPLSGLVVAIDPGHGGDDPGALGVPGESGPTEKQLNLANAYALQRRLEALGATVHLLQEDTSMTLNDRMERTAQLDADVFISCHHNSISELVDSNEVSGIEVYYYEDQAGPFAQAAGASLAEDTGRRLRWVEQSYYRVTMTTLCPAILVESGYICNPLEYGEICDPFAMFCYGNAIADAVVQYFSTL